MQIIILIVGELFLLGIYDAYAQQPTQTISPSEMALHINSEISQLASVAEQQDRIITDLKKQNSEKDKQIEDLKAKLPKDDSNK